MIEGRGWKVITKVCLALNLPTEPTREWNMQRSRCVPAISFPEHRSPWPTVGKRELWEHPFLNNKGNNRILHIRFHCAVRSLHVWYLWRMPEMDAPRALVFRPLLKGNEALGTRLPPMRICFEYIDTWSAVTRVLSRGRERTLGTRLRIWVNL